MKTPVSSYFMMRYIRHHRWHLGPHRAVHETVGMDTKNKHLKQQSASNQA